MHKFFEAYKRSGYSRRFFEANREQLQLHQAAKEFFNTKNITKFPKMKELSDEYDRILTEKKREYAEYKKVKESMQDYMIARQNLETLQGDEAKEAVDRNRQEGRNQEKRGGRS